MMVLNGSSHLHGFYERERERAAILTKKSRLHTGTCPGGDLSLWGFGASSEKEMEKCCRPLKVEVFRLQDDSLLQRGGWKPAQVSGYRGMHGMMVPEGEHQAKATR